MPTPPTLATEYENGWSSTTWPRTVSVTTAVGDKLVAAAMHAEFGGASDVLQTPTGGTSLTWTAIGQINIALNSVVAVWTATATTAETFTLSINTAGGSPVGGIDVVKFSAATSDGFGNSAVNNGSGAPSLAVTTAHDNSALVAWFADWNENDGSSRTWRTINSVTPAAGSGELVYQDVSFAATFYGAHWSDAGTAGSKTTGLTAPGGQKWSGIAVEVRGSAGTTDATVNATAISAAASMPAPALSTGSTVTAAPVAAAASMPAPAVSGGATVSPAAVTATTSLPAPDLSTGVTVSPATVAASSTLPDPDLSAGATVTASPVTATTALPAPDLATGATVSPGPVVASSTLPPPTVTTLTAVTPDPVAATSSMPAPALSAGVTVSPAPILATATIPTPTVLVPGQRLPLLSGTATVRALSGSATVRALSGTAQVT